MRKHNAFTLLAGCTAVVLALTACTSGSKGGGGSSSSNSSPDASLNAGKTLHAVVGTLPKNLGNPFYAVGPPRAQTVSAIFDALTRVSANGKLQPWLATSWKRIDNNTWQFSLRHDVNFSNGEPFNADSVVASVQGLIGPTGTGSQAKLALPTVSGVKKVDQYTVDISTSNNDGVLPQQVAALNAIPPKYWKQVGPKEFTKKPIGTGPYVAKHLSTTEWDLVANPKSWRKPMIGKVVITQLLDFSARTNALRSGQADIDFAGDLDQLSSLKSAGFTAAPLPNQGVFALQFVNTSGKSSPLDSQKVRLALNMAVDRDSLAKAVYQGLAAPANQGLSPGTTGYDSSIPKYPYDPTKAKQLLKEAGYSNGLSLTAEVSVGVFLGDTDVYQAVQSDLKKIGVNLSIKQITTAAIVKDLLAGKWPTDMFSTAYLSAPVKDATRGYFTNSCLRSPGAWCDKAQANLISEAVKQSVGTQQRTDTLNQLATKIHENPPALFLFDVLRLAYVGKNVGGFSQDSSSNTKWEDIYFK